MEFSKSIFKRTLLNSLLFSGILIVITFKAPDVTAKNQDKWLPCENEKELHRYLRM